jgi:hypothetical protein
MKKNVLLIFSIVVVFSSCQSSKDREEQTIEKKLQQRRQDTTIQAQPKKQVIVDCTPDEIIKDLHEILPHIEQDSTSIYYTSKSSALNSTCRESLTISLDKESGKISRLMLSASWGLASETSVLAQETSIAVLLRNVLKISMDEAKALWAKQHEILENTSKSASSTMKINAVNVEFSGYIRLNNALVMITITPIE